MAKVMSAMPDVWQRVLSEHAPDERGLCRACRDGRGVAARWPCMTRGIAERARLIHNGAVSEPAWSPRAQRAGRHAAP